ncbi:TetR family transcriptional regulator C-terminal domain-containing protein [Nocardiopsis sp. HNM0947]|uniref:TetR family transcriptional regulator C-terminal domain-containing protein n=1 Tax=Nocardiopsis coralli TaxID=2772213 RepID=A0ABR9P6Q1_9ACTN|nr:TetR family transcriptional regulator C-terminal domain-containing protein [Nocardiopsis coralli]MBE2999517.1 TetR family transcriptional regulator C-terminal domain-containing protein [Nocardiopsis coralli]
MPKIVDHEQRRRDLAQALWRVIANQGPAAVSIRSVAAEAGLSAGALRHYFQTREQLLLFAMELSEQRVRQRLQEQARRAQAPDADPDLIERVAGFAEQLLPLDPTRRAEYRAWEAAGELGEQDAHRQERWDQQRKLYRQLVAALAHAPLQDPSGPHPDPRVEEWAEHLHTYVDGLALQLGVTPLVTGAQDVQQRLRTFLCRIGDHLARDSD